MAIIPWALVLVAHIAILIATAAFGSDTSCVDTRPVWACSDESPFNPLFLAWEDGFNIFSTDTLRAGETILKVLLFDYEMLKQDGAVLGTIGFAIRAVAVGFLGVAIVMSALSIFRL